VTDADASNTTGSAGAASNGTPEPAAVERARRTGELVAMFDSQDAESSVPEVSERVSERTARAVEQLAHTDPDAVGRLGLIRFVLSSRGNHEAFARRLASVED